MMTCWSLCTCFPGLCILELYVKYQYVILMWDPLSQKCIWLCLWLLTAETIPKAFWESASWIITLSSVQFSSVAQSCLTLWDPMNRSTPGLPVHHPLPEFTQTHVYQVSDAIQPSHPLSAPSPPVPNPSQHQSLFQWVNSLHEVAKVLDFQL